MFYLGSGKEGEGVGGSDSGQRDQSTVLVCSGAYNKNTLHLLAYKQQEFISHNSEARSLRSGCQPG